MIEEYLKKIHLFQSEAAQILGIEKRKKSGKAKYYIGIITSTIDEFSSIKKIITDLEEVDESNNALICYSGKISTKSGNVDILLSLAIEMGMEASIILTTKLLEKYSFEYVFMLGVAAGNKNRVNIGDVLFAEQTLNYNQVAEIEKKDRSIQKKYMQNSISIDTNLKSKIKRLATSNVIDYIKSNNSIDPQHLNKLSIKPGLLVTGSSLLRSDQKMAEINSTYHNVIGMDMESSGFYYAISNVDKNEKPYFLTIKSVSDFGDSTSHRLDSKHYENKIRLDII